MLRFALGLASFRKNVEVSVPVVEDVHFHCLLRTAYSLPTHLRGTGFVRSDFRPQPEWCDSYPARARQQVCVAKFLEVSSARTIENVIGLSIIEVA
jgi:hypothetical protein